MECHQNQYLFHFDEKLHRRKQQTSKSKKAPTGNEISFRLKQQIGGRDDMEFHLHQTEDF